MLRNIIVQELTELWSFEQVDPRTAENYPAAARKQQVTQ